ncbi:threonine/serine exporter [Clostridium sp. MCC353]|uniref:threonine/serine exporter family protein n=1 Tax=Clostridium sp. MCC353 TaxID=2592646 RepID=UPI001C02032E|nr:threonine/serine exporter family protein [Clostridium sp. MCC353]MBT9775760.1 threonine/serine exporter [Clostridium sp. MCC353]
MNDKLLVETAVLAGEIMLVSGAEIYRVEDTINRMLRKADRQTSEAIVLSTGIFVTLNDPAIEPITVARRVTDRSTNLNKVYLVNNVSRQFCNGQVTVEEAYEKLRQAETMQQYRPWLKNVGVVGASMFFAILLGGGLADCLAAAFVGGLLAGVLWLSGRIRLNAFCQTSLGAFTIAVAALVLKQWIVPELHRDIIIIGCIMPLVPGVIFTTAIRDTLNGDYSAGAARMLEAVVIALAVAAGVGIGMAFFSRIAGGISVW